MVRAMIALVSGATVTVADGQGGRSESRSAFGIDLASVHSAPFDEFIGVYDDLFERCSLTLEFLDRSFHASEPVIVVGLEVGIEGEPSRPVLFAHPGHCQPHELGHV